MQICPASPAPRVLPQSIIEAKNKIRLGHDECCNCCCCCTPQPSCYKYVQPDVPKSYAPMRYYWKSGIPMEDYTTYRLSYWDGPANPSQLIHPANCLTVGDGPISDETTQKLSYLGNWCVKPETPCTPCSKQWLGRGPMQDVTTQKHDFTWKSAEREKPYKLQPNLYCPCANMSDDTTYKMSYYNSACRIPAKPFKPFRRYEKSDVPMEGCTTYRLSYWPNETPVKFYNSAAFHAITLYQVAIYSELDDLQNAYSGESVTYTRELEPQPWNPKLQYIPPATPMEGCTTYKLSYWPNNEPPRKPFSLQETENILNAKCCFDENTTYKLSYFGCGGERPEPIKRQSESEFFSNCPLSHDTTHKLSYLGNWCVKPESPCTPCTKSLLGRGPMQDVTTQKHDYTWSNQPSTRPNIRPEDNLEFSSLPLDCCTTHRLSYFPNNLPGLVENRSFKPMHKYCPSGVPMEGETTMKLSYQPVEAAVPPEKPWVPAFSYHPPVNSMEDNTTYNMSYIPPGSLVPLDPCSQACPTSDTCAAPRCPPCPPAVIRPCGQNGAS